MAKDVDIPPLVILAFDGGDADFIEQWAQEGYLPTIASIVKHGCRGRIVGPELMSTQGAWLSLFSGVSRSEHGHYFYRQLVPGTYTIKNAPVRDQFAKPFWSQLRDGSKKVAIVDALETEPLSNLSGLQVSNWAFQQQFNQPIKLPSAEPAGFVNEAFSLVGAPIHVPIFKPGSTLHEDVEAYCLLLRRVETKGILCRHVLAQDRFDLTVISFVEAHTVAHRLWDYRSGGIRHAEAQGEGYQLGNAIRDVYQAIDRELGLLLKQLPDEANVFILSLFGMKDLYPTNGLIEAFCERLGYRIPARGPGKNVNPLAWLRRMVRPDVRARLSRLLPRIVRQRLETNRFQQETDWSKTRAFPLPSLQASFLRVNLRGREPQGTVNPGPEYDSLLSEIEADLKQLVDACSGEPAVARVIRTAEAFRCGPHSALPDLVVEWKSTSYLMDRVRHPKVELVQEKQYYNRSSHHTMAGFVAAAGPSIREEGDIGEVSPLDFASMFLSLMGEPCSQRSTERPMNSILRDLSLRTGTKSMAS